MTKPTYSGIATLAKVGTATVERVLNGRGGVRPQTAARVIAAARALDWPGRLPETHRGLLLVEVIIVGPKATFFRRLAAAFRRIGASLDSSVQVQVTFFDPADAISVADHIRRPARPRAALIIASTYDPQIRPALAEQLASGLPIVEIVTPVLDGADFVGIDNYAVGRSAGYMLSRMCQASGTILAVCHSGAYQVHRDRVRGFSDFLAEKGRPDLNFSYAIFGLDDPGVMRRRMEAALSQWPDVVGVYSVGGQIRRSSTRCRARKPMCSMLDTN
ncbi:MAG: LacI family DNA-binding transcriptional regulator [Rhodobacteraceae bacterium]|nr:LacI family DNA-binding transcriptional regulator [Paracoccaceae bacterium]